MNRAAETRVLDVLRERQRYERAHPDALSVRMRGPGTALHDLLFGLSRPERRATRKALERLVSEGAVVTVERTWRYAEDPDDDGLMYLVPSEAGPGA